MDTGAVAFIDCLGFKGIWQRYPPQAVIELLISVEKAGREVAESFGKYIGPSSTKCVSLSDTIVVTAVKHPQPNDAPEPVVRGMLVGSAALAARAIASLLMS